MNIAKYAFKSENKAKELIEKYSEQGHAFVELGYLNESEKYSVDVLWIGLENHPEDWLLYAIEVEENGAHTFAGMDYQQYKFKEHTEIILDTSM
jgi:hypothetical protein